MGNIYIHTYMINEMFVLKTNHKFAFADTGQNCMVTKSESSLRHTYISLLIKKFFVMCYLALTVSKASVVAFNE